MEYSRFLKLLDGGEKYNVDFKIHFDPFSSKTLTQKGELAKDICAMANNGNVVSYIVVGVSDDRRKFVSVNNDKLTDDNLQDFCKKNIYPPPLIKVSREEWKRANPEHSGKTFVIIQVGPNKQQAFRLNQDFISYKENLCYRRNEVWIRRGATTDLATPEETAQLTQGKPVDDITKAQDRKIERDSFSRLSQDDKKDLISELTIKVLKYHEYTIVRMNERPKVYIGTGTHQLPVSWKLFDSVLMLFYNYSCFDNFLISDLEYYQFFLPKVYSDIADLPQRVITKHSNNIEGVRRVYYFPVIASFPRTRIQKSFPSWRWTGDQAHYYLPEIKRDYHREEKSKQLASSSELLIVDKIISRIDYEEKLTKAIEHLESCRETIMPLS